MAPSRLPAAPSPDSITTSSAPNIPGSRAGLTPPNTAACRDDAPKNTHKHSNSGTGDSLALSACEVPNREFESLPQLRRAPHGGYRSAGHANIYLEVIHAGFSALRSYRRVETERHSWSRDGNRTHAANPGTSSDPDALTTQLKALDPTF
ncbi:hypothetical protein Bbelb_188820 [Branchiostoma belcheri]|nr:hypothetical protein Bbelb_188820 [Branchiostoma belcheri]